MDAADVCVVSSRDNRGGLVVRIGVPLADVYLEFLGGRCRPNTVLAAAYDLKVFFTVVARPPDQVRPADVLAFITAQRTGRGGDRALQPVGLAEEPGGVSAATVRRRLSIVSGFFAFLQARGDVTANPVPRGLPTRRERSRPGQGVPLVRAVRRLPRILSPAQVDALTAALRTHRDQAMVAAMVLGGLRRCEVLGLRLEDLRVAERRVFVAEGKGGRQRLIPVSGRFFAAVAAYLDAERPPGGVLADRLQQPVAAAARGGLGDHQRLAGQQVNQVQRGRLVPVAAHRGRRGQVEPSREHRQRAEPLALLLREQLIAPGDRGPQRLVPRVGHRPRITPGT